MLKSVKTVETIEQFLVSSVSTQNFAPEMSEETKILERCERLFMRYGIKSVTMDDVARELGVSKKTLYQHFENKEELVRKVTSNHFACQDKMVERVMRHSKSAIDEMFAIATWMNTMSQNLNPALLYDLRKYHQDSWQVFIEHRNFSVINSIKHNLKRGIKEGLYREELDVEIMARIYVARVEMFLDDEIFPYDKFPPQKTFNVFMDYHIRGIATSKGIKYLEKIKSEHHGI